MQTFRSGHTEPLPSRPRLPAGGADVSEATSRYANRYLERAALQSRLKSRRPGAIPVPTMALDTEWLRDALAPLFVPDAQECFARARGDCPTAVRRMLAPLPGGRMLAIDVVPATVRFDPSDLARLMLELVDNASRYAPTGATVRVRGAPGVGGYQLSVTNPGERMPRWALASLRLGRADPLPGDPAGLSLGLPIAARLAALNDTRVEVLRAAGRPNTLRIVAPVA